MDLNQPTIITTIDDDYFVVSALLPTGEFAGEARCRIRLHGEDVLEVQKLGTATRPTRQEAIDACMTFIEAHRNRPFDPATLRIEYTHPLLTEMNAIWTAVTGEQDTWQYPAQISRETTRLIRDLRAENAQLRSAVDVNSSNHADDIHVDY